MISLRHIESFYADHDYAERDYANFHKYRYLYLLNKLLSLVDGRADLRLLDVGPFYQTALIRHYFPTLQVNTMGFNKPENELGAGETHWTVDLNATELFNQRAEVGQHQLVVFSEVLEHLYTPPETVLAFLACFISPGGFLLLQTPNAVSLVKRLYMLMGRNPFELISSAPPSHFREYTSREVAGFLEGAGLEVCSVSLRNYFNPAKTLLQRLFRISGRVLPPQLRDGITIVARKNQF